MCNEYSWIKKRAFYTIKQKEWKQLARDAVKSLITSNVRWVIIYYSQVIMHAFVFLKVYFKPSILLTGDHWP